MTEVRPDKSGDFESVDFSTHVVLQSNDPTPVYYSMLREASMMSGLIKDILEDQDKDDKDEEKVIPIPNVNARTLKYVIQYMEHYYMSPPPPLEKRLSGKLSDEDYTLISKWDKEFLYTDLVKGGDEKQHGLLIDVIMAANFLNMKELLDLTIAALASIFKGKTVEQMRETFGIHNQVSPEEEAKFREEFKWIEE
eukprot:RCo017427